MDLAGSVVNAVLVEGVSNVKEVCQAHDISRSWLYELIARYHEAGEEGLRPQARRPHSSPTRVVATVEEEIVPRRALSRAARFRTGHCAAVLRGGSRATGVGCGALGGARDCGGWDSRSGEGDGSEVVRLEVRGDRLVVLPGCWGSRFDAADG
jgi:hypothetical protein